MRTLLFVPFLIALILLMAAGHGLFGLSVDPKLRVGDALGILNTTLLALILQHFLAKKGKALEGERNLVLSHIEEASKAIKMIKGPIKESIDQVPSPMQSRQIVEAFEDCIEEFATLEGVIESSHCSSLLSQCREISDLLLRYKNAITGADFPRRIFQPHELNISSRMQRVIAMKLQLLAISVSNV